MNQELFKQIEVLNEDREKCQECSRKKIPEASKEDEEEEGPVFSPVKDDDDDKENDFRRKKAPVVSKGKNLVRAQSDCKAIFGKRSYEKVRNMNIERGVFSEQKLSKREAKDWDLADDADDYDDLKLVKKVKPTVE